MISFGETRSTWFKYLPNWGRFNNRDQLNPGKKRRKKKKAKGRRKGRKKKTKPTTEKAANPLLPSPPAPGSHTHTRYLLLSHGGSGRGRAAGPGRTRTHTHTPGSHSPSPARPSPHHCLRPPARSALSGCFVRSPARGSARPPAPRRSGTFIIGRGLISNRCHRGSIVRRAARPRPPLCGAAAIGRRRAEGCRHRSGSPFICALGRWTPHLISNQGDFSIFSLSTVRLQIWDFLLLLFTKLGLLFFFFFLRSTFSSLFFPSLLCCCFLISSTLNFLKGVHYNRFCSLFSFFFPSGVCVCCCCCWSPSIYTNPTLFVSPPFGSVEFSLLNKTAWVPSSPRPLQRAKPPPRNLGKQWLRLHPRRMDR